MLMCFSFYSDSFLSDSRVVKLLLRMNDIRIKRIAQTIADVVDCHDGDEDHQAGVERDPRGAEDLILRGGENTSPGWGGGLYAESQITQS